MQITPELLSHLKDKARAATPGPWGSSKSGKVGYMGSYDYPEEVCKAKNREIAKYIAAASPDVVLALITDYQDKKEALYGLFLIINKLRDKLSLSKEAKLHEVIGFATSHIEQLEKETDWLAEFAVGGECPPEIERGMAGGAVLRCEKNCIGCWRTAARKAVEENYNGH